MTWIVYRQLKARRTIVINVTTNKAVGASIRRTRKGHDMTISALGKSVNVSPQQISKYESGKNGIGVDMLLRIADALDVDPCGLLPANDSARQMISLTPDIKAAQAIAELPQGREFMIALAAFKTAKAFIAGSVLFLKGEAASRGRPRKKAR
jgi:transcriptional regulator with XRE-family HTH domain